MVKIPDAPGAKFDFFKKPEVNKIQVEDGRMAGGRGENIAVQSQVVGNGHGENKKKSKIGARNHFPQVSQTFQTGV